MTVCLHTDFGISEYCFDPVHVLLVVVISVLVLCMLLALKSERFRRRIHLFLNDGMPSKVIVALLVILLGSGVLLAIGSIPVSAFNGGKAVTVCNLSMDISGAYNDNGFSHSITDFAFSAGSSSCHQQTLLDLLPQSSSPLNLFPTTIQFNIVLTNQQDGSTHGPYTITANIPALQYEYNFQGNAEVSNVPAGSYAVQITSSVPFSSGSTSYSSTASVG